MSRSDTPSGAISNDTDTETLSIGNDDTVSDREVPAPRWPWIAGTILSILGLGISAYLTYEYYTGSKTLACPVPGHGSIINCAKVTTSPWSVEFGLPVAVLGLAYFAAMVCLQSPWAWAWQSRPLRAARLAFCLASLFHVTSGSEGVGCCRWSSGLVGMAGSDAGGVGQR